MQATALVVGIIVGAAVFVQSSDISRHVPSIRGMILVWMLSGVLTLCGALVCAELASAFSETGGVYIFLKEGLSREVGFLWGWAMFWSVHSGIIAATGVIFARFVGYFMPLDDRGIRVVAILSILLLSAVNYFGVKQGSAVQTVLTIAKVLAIVLILAFFFAFGHPSHAPSPAITSAAMPPIGAHQIILGVIAGLFAFGGWHMVTYSAGETRSPEKTIPRALLVGTVVVTLCYLALNAAYLYVLPLHQVIASNRVAADAANALAGPKGAAAISALVILSAFGSLNGIILAGPRVYYAMANDGLVFRWLGAVHPRFQTPHLAILLQALWSAGLVATDTYRGLFTRVIYTEWLFFALMTIGLFRLRRKPGYSPSYRTWGYPLVPVFFIVASLTIIANQIAAEPLKSVSGLLLVALGLPVYYLWVRRRTQGAIENGHH